MRGSGRDKHKTSTKKRGRAAGKASERVKNRSRWDLCFFSTRAPLSLGVRGDEEPVVAAKTKARIDPEEREVDFSAASR